MTAPVPQRPPAWLFHVVFWTPITTLVAGLVLRRSESADAAAASRALLTFTVLCWVGIGVAAYLRGIRPWGPGPFSVAGLLVVWVPALIFALGVYVRG